MSRQCTDYRNDITGSLIARVSEHVQGHHAGEVVILPKVGRVYITAICPVVIERENNNFEHCVAIHEIKVRVDGTA